MDTNEPTTETDEPVGTLADALRDYTLAATALELFRDAHREVLADLEILQGVVTAHEQALKELARRLGPVENDAYTVNVSYPKRRWYDCDLILERTPYIREIPGVVVTTTTVDRAKVEALVKGGFVPASVAGEALREEPMTPAVTIKRRGGAVAG